ncbi:MAG: hypothetical protein JXR03_11200 [Cyclobacteriaceae bacterium]
MTYISEPEKWIRRGGFFEFILSEKEELELHLRFRMFPDLVGKQPSWIYSLISLGNSILICDTDPLNEYVLKTRTTLS